MPGKDLKPIQGVLRKILEIERNDRLSAGTNCGSEHVAIIGVRQLQLFYQVLVACHQAVGYRFIDQLNRPLELSRIEIGSLM